MSKKSERKSRHLSSPTAEVGRGNPSSSSGRLGDQKFNNIPGEGVVHMLRTDRGWQKMSTSKGGTSQGDSKSDIPQAITMAATSTTGAGGGTTTDSHTGLLNLDADDHPQYSHISTNRTITANHTFSGNPSFSNIDINGGTINGITDLAIADGGTGASNSNAWLNTRITTNADGSLNYDATTATAVNHDSLADFVSDEHIAHSGVDIVAGSGLTGGGNIAATRTLNVIGGTCITANANDIQVTNDSITDTQLAYNTGQHLTTGSSPGFVALTLSQSDGTTPMTVTSTTKVSNLNADKADGYDFNQDVRSTASPQFSNMTMGESTGSSPNFTYTNGNIGTAQFASGFTGAGWKIDRDGNEYNFEADNMTIRGTLSVYELLIQQIRATNGSIFVSACAKVDTVSGSAYTETIVFEDPSDHNVCPFVAGDIILAQRVRLDSTTLVKRHVREVDSVNGKTIVCKATSGGPSDVSSTAIEPGDDFVRLGNSDSTNYDNRQGGVYLTADDSNAPFIDVFDNVTSWSQWTGFGKTKVRLGKLDGITDTGSGLSGSQSDLYGLYSDSVYLTGHIKATSGSIGGINMVSSKLYTGTGTFNNANTGIYLDSSSNFSLGNKLAWNNSTLAIDGTVTIGGTTASVVVSGAASGTTANQDSTGDIQAGTTADNVGLGNVDNSNFASDGDIEGGEVGGWTINSDAIFTGTKDTSGYTSTNGHITISSSGSIHTPKFYVNSDGTAGFKGTVTIGSTNLSESNTLNENTTKAQVGLTNVEDKSSSTIRGEITKANVTDTGLAKGDINLGNVDNTSDATVLSTAASAANTASKTDGYVGGWEISSTAILGVANGSARIVMTAAGDIVTNQWAIKRDGSASFANNSITFETNGDISSNDYLIERSRLFGAGQDSWNGSSYTDTWISSSSRSSAYGENTYAINVAPETSSEVSNGYGSRIMYRTSSYWVMVQDAYFKNFTVKSGTYLLTQGYRIFCSGTFTIENNAHIQNDGSSISGLGTHNGASGAPEGTLTGGADGHHSGAGGAGAGSGSQGGHGGAGGGGGGMILISARYIVNNGLIRAKGGNGGGGVSIAN